MRNRIRTANKTLTLDGVGPVQNISQYQKQKDD